MKLILPILLFCQIINAQIKEFSLNDTVFEENSVHRTSPLFYNICTARGYGIQYNEKNKEIIDQFVEFFNRNPNLTVEIGIHTDHRGSEAYNLALTERKAKNIGILLKERGLLLTKIIIKAYGESKPIITKQEIDKMATKDEKKKANDLNRRIELKILKIE